MGGQYPNTSSTKLRYVAYLIWVNSVHNTGSCAAVVYLHSIHWILECLLWLHFLAIMQSSCTKPDIEAESARLNDVQDLLQPKCCSSLTVDSTLHECEEPVKLGRKLLHESKAEGMPFFMISCFNHFTGYLFPFSNN